MDDKLKNALYERYTRSCRPQYFASWAKPKASELNILRHRHLGGNKEVIWDIAKDSGKAADHIEMAGFYASAIISYGKNKDGELKLMKHLTVPTLRWHLRNTPRPSLSRAICPYLREQATKPRLSAGSLPPSISPRLSKP